MKKIIKDSLRILIIILIVNINLYSKILFEKYFENNYNLPRKANINQKLEKSNFNQAKFKRNKILIGDFYSTDIQDNLYKFEDDYLQLSFEFDILNHVNQDVGFTTLIKDENSNIKLLFGILGKNIIIKDNINQYLFSIDSILIKNNILNNLREFPYKNFNYYVVFEFNNKNCIVRINNYNIITINLNNTNFFSKGNIVDIDGYFHLEPFMKIPNLVRRMKISNFINNQNYYAQEFSNFKRRIDNGIKKDGFYFNAGPFLTSVTKNSISISWETTELADFIVEYDTNSNLSNKTILNKSENKIINYEINNLLPEKTYYYQIIGINERKDTIKTGILTFKTAVNDDSPFSFVLIGDTEARPFINNQLNKLIWDERPNFMIICGDLTDGGIESNKYEWNFEFFEGMNQIISKIPVYPILGNGEIDKYWYLKYTNLYGKEDYYTVKFGNSEFFFLNSNLKEEIKKGGKIYNWLDSSLNSSKMEWKFLVMHHAIYSSDEDDYGDTWKGMYSPNGDLRLRDLVNLIDKYNIDIVFYGHLHTYERTFRLKNNKVSENGTTYIVTGGAGGNLEDFTPTKTWFNQKTFRGHHYLKIDINKKNLSFFMYDINGILKDYFFINK